MNTKVLFIAPLTTLLLAVGGAALAATPGGDAATMPNGPGAMHTPSQDGSPSGMNPMMRGGMSGGMMNGGMMGMVGGCPMMGASGGKNGKVMMQMHGEMMRAMGDIMIKYADKLEPSASTN
ncbi:hypothetical protein V0R37_12455 [Pollutimonas sp. H1-120]|uniref:hypothetical protein n=1 Tax=Pollutimonas sp. H1-120 TaxID=3148824 RepID=UPI003B520A53